MLGRLGLGSAVFGVLIVTFSGVADATPMRRTIFLNRNGGVYKQSGTNDSSNNLASVVGSETISQVQVPPAPLTDPEWDQVVQCMKDVYAPFSVVITDVDPGTADHIEVVVGDVVATQLNELSANPYHGTAPLTSCSGGQPIDRAVTFVFAGQIKTALPGSYVKRICEYAALEAGIALTLEPEYDCASVMSYRDDCDPAAPRAFLATASCGDDKAESCRCGGTTQAAKTRLDEVLGPFDAVPPTISITEPADGATVGLGFVVKADAADETQLVKVELWIDGAYVSADNFPAWELPTPANLAPGAHTIELRAYDNGANVTAAMIAVTVESECTTDADCALLETCVGGACLGDFTAPCERNSDCATNLCAEGPDGNVCTAVCEGAGAATCPAGTTCQTAPGGGLDKCLANEESGCACRAGGRAGGRAAATGAGLLAALGFALAFAGSRRRGRRALVD
jgi:hypothetical protein